jgi:hypothetical protein
MALAFHFRVPVVAPFAPTFQSWIDENKTGWFFSSGDSKDLRNVLEDVWSGKLKYNKEAIVRKEKEMERKTMKNMKSVFDQVKL